MKNVVEIYATLRALVEVDEAQPVTHKTVQLATQRLYDQLQAQSAANDVLICGIELHHIEPHGAREI